MTVPVYDIPESPILIVGFFGILFTLVLLYFVNRDYFASPLNRDRRTKYWQFVLVWVRRPLSRDQRKQVREKVNTLDTLQPVAIVRRKDIEDKVNEHTDY